MIKYFLGFSMIVAVAACHAEQPTAPSDVALRGLTEAAHHTSYLAKIQHTKVTKEHSVDVDNNEEYEKHIYSAKVLKTFRGTDAAEIRYEMRVELGEDAVLETTPIIIALCADNLGKLYWPGTGALFPVDQQTEAWLNKHKATLPQNTDNSWCDNINN